MSGEVVIRRAVGRAGPPGATAAPAPPPLRAEPTPPPSVPRRRTTRQVVNDAAAATGEQQATPTPAELEARLDAQAAVRSEPYPAHKKVLADLYEQRAKIDIAISAIEALYE